MIKMIINLFAGYKGYGFECLVGVRHLKQELETQLKSKIYCFGHMYSYPVCSFYLKCVEL